MLSSLCSFVAMVDAGSESGPQSTDASSFQALAETPGIFQHIYDHLSTFDRWALRCTCRRLQSQVDQCVHTLKFTASPSGAEAVAAWVKQLAASDLRPRRLVLCGSAHALDLLTSPEAAQVWEGVQGVQTQQLTGALSNALATSMPNLQELRVQGIQVQADADWHNILPQFSRLHSLRLESDNSDASSTFYGGLLQVPSLRMLKARSCFSYPALAALSQLQDLTLPTLHTIHLAVEEAASHPSIQGVGPAILGKLTGLTALQLIPTYDMDAPALWQEQLSSALTALSQLQRLELPRVWPGPIPAALGQLTALTQLCLSLSQPALEQALYLPGVQLLRLLSADPGFLSTLDAPKLQSIQGYVWHLEWGAVGVTSVGIVNITLQANNDSHKQEAVLLEQCAKGALRKCNRLMVTPCGRDLEPETAQALLQVLGRWWRPDPSLVDGSSPHVQDQAAAAGGWHLTLVDLPVSRSAVAALPQGLMHLILGSCQLEADSLEPLAQLPSLKRLVLADLPCIEAYHPALVVSSAGVLPQHRTEGVPDP